MFVEGVFRREPGSRAATPSIFIAESRVSHRPPTRYRSVRIRSRTDVETARRVGLPISLLESERIEKLGYPLSFRARLLTPQQIVPLIETTYRLLPMADIEAARDPKLEDLIVALLSIDALGARRVASDHRRDLDPIRLLKRVLAEDLEGRAYGVRLDEFAPGIPKVPGIEPLSAAALAVEDSRAFSRGS
ncbi:MAG: hypothetical protein L3K05_00240 [Thermoplasmata archaeon]|nr:hypothetical protein [Thermoplasmata archaeon]